MKKTLTFAAAFAACICAWADTNLKAVQYDGTSTVYSLASVQRVEFDAPASGDASMRVLLKDGTAGAESVRAIIFTSETPTGVAELAGSDVRYFLFPNPVSDELVLTGPDAGTPVRVYDLSGRKVLETEAGAEGARLGVSGLTPGAYIVCAGQTALRFVKR